MFDCGKKETILESNATLLKKFGGEIMDNQKFKNTVIIQPIRIAKNYKIKNSIIRPNVFLGENVIIDNSILRIA